ncbi:MAG: energy-coupling factor transporter transmembrane component T [Propionibacterium freudenreichii]
MSAETFLGAYRVGHSLMHRCPLWVKYLLLVAVGVVPFFAKNVPLSLAAFAVAAVLVVAGSGMGISQLNPGVGLLVMNAVIVAYDWIFRTWQEGVVFASGMIATLWLARIITSTTPSGLIMDGIAACARPFRIIGANPEKFALAVSVMWSSIPYLLVSVRNVLDAARARGLRFSWRFVAPVLVTAVGHALQVGEALQARGLGD